MKIALVLVGFILPTIAIGSIEDATISTGGCGMYELSRLADSAHTASQEATIVKEISDRLSRCGGELLLEMSLLGSSQQAPAPGYSAPIWCGGNVGQGHSQGFLRISTGAGNTVEVPFLRGPGVGSWTGNLVEDELVKASIESTGTWGLDGVDDARGLISFAGLVTLPTTHRLDVDVHCTHLLSDEDILIPWSCGVDASGYFMAYDQLGRDMFELSVQVHLVAMSSGIDQICAAPDDG